MLKRSEHSTRMNRGAGLPPGMFSQRKPRFAQKNDRLAIE
jgi:hypothetical protein